MRAVTLIELLLVIAVAGLLAGLAIPRAAALADRLAVEGEAARLVEGYRRARQAAGAAMQPARLIVEPGSIRLYLLVDGPRGRDSTLVWHGPGPAHAGVRLEGGSPSALFAPSGVTHGVANGRYLLEKGGISRAVVASRLGRLRIER